MLKKILICSFILVLTSSITFCQEKKSVMAVSWYPQLLFMRGLRADIDVHLGNSSSWIIFSPQFYLAEMKSAAYQDIYDDYNNQNRYKKLEGYGAELSHRIYVRNKTTPAGLYLSYGVMYNHFDITYEDDWGPLEYNGLPAITYGLFEHTTTIDKTGPNIILGYQKKVLDNIFIDIFCGGGMRYSFIKTSSLAPRNFNDDIFHFGYTGTVPLAGFRIGIVLP